MGVESIVQPARGTTLDHVRACAIQYDKSNLDTAVAYITSSGLTPFLEGIGIEGRQKATPRRVRWLTSFDYFRTDPAALQRILDIHSKRVRIVGGKDALNRKCVPRRPFHPKVFLFDATDRGAIIAGSGNLSYSGLVRGHEAGLVVKYQKMTQPPQADSMMVRKHFSGWYSKTWRFADPLDTKLLADYRELYDQAPNRKSPNPTEDDILPENQPSGALSHKDLSKVRACRRLWIVAGNVTKNRGKNLPGNQIMMKRMTRVFFGAPAENVAPDTPLKDLWIRYSSNAAKLCTLAYSNNKMDKVTVPIPGNGGPPKYDNECLLFERRGPDEYLLRIISATEKKRLVSASKKIDAHFKMKGGREWGVF